MKNKFNTPFGRLCVVGYGEGISYLILLSVAMPLKYFAGMPLAVRVTGLIHGILFIAYILALVQAAVSLRWTFLKASGAFAASLVPFGTFYLERLLKQDK